MTVNTLGNFIFRQINNNIIKTAVWAPVADTDVKIDYDLKTFPLEIKTDSETDNETDSETDSGDKLDVYFRASGNLTAGGIGIGFN